MTKEEMYELLAKKHEQTNWDNRASVKAYNEYARMLRHLLYEAEEENK